MALPTIVGTGTQLTFAAGHPCAGDTLRITFNGNGNYSYEYTLGTAKQHGLPGSATDEALDVRLTVTDTGPGGTNTVYTDIHVKDDVMAAVNPNQVLLEESPPDNRYVTFVLDFSSSMDTRDTGIKGLNPSNLNQVASRFEVMKKAMLGALEEYQDISEYGDVKINFVYFASGAYVKGTDMTVAQAQTIVNTWVSSGSPSHSGTGMSTGATHYDAALNNAQPLVTNALNNSNYNDYRHQIFFLTDGLPTNNTTHAVTQAWKDLANGPLADRLEVLAVGMGSSGVNATNMWNAMKGLVRESELADPDGDVYVRIDNYATFENVLRGLADADPHANIGDNNLLGADGLAQISGYILNGIQYNINWGPIGASGFFRIVLATDGNGDPLAYLDLRQNGDYILRNLGTTPMTNYAMPQLVVRDADGDPFIMSGSLGTVPYNPFSMPIGGFSAFMPEELAASAQSLGGAEGQYIQGGAGDDELQGGAGNDIIYGGSGVDLVYGGAGDDAIHGGAGDDLLLGEAGSDTLHGGDGDDIMQGGEGNDTLYGDAGSDILHGGEGDDLLYGGIGDDAMYGGAGNDVFAWTQNDLGGVDNILDFNLDGDKLFFEGLFNSQESVQDQIAHMLSDGELLLSMSDAGHVSLAYNGQEVNITLNHDMDYSAFNSIQDDDPDAKARLLQQILLATM
jgi:Ca2+-binding RTX toxin-like protein